MIPFNIPCRTDYSYTYVNMLKSLDKLSGDGTFNKKCCDWIDRISSNTRSLLTPSCTAALEMAALLVIDNMGDEVIMPSYTFVSTANAFVLRGCVPVFIDIRPDTMNINEKLIEAAITDKTKAIVVVHYAGVSCEMDSIIEIANKNKLYVIEDAAQAVMSKYKDKYLGGIGDIGCFSFHETKNYTCGEGGAILLNNESLVERAEIIREKGTDRSKFYRGQVDKYTWIDVGSSYLLSELCSAYLYGQLEIADEILKNRLAIWNRYYNGLKDLASRGIIELPLIPDQCEHNGHMFYIKCENSEERSRLIEHLKKQGIQTVFHYVPLHSSPAGKKFTRFHGEDRWTTRESERLLRLPLYYKLSESDNMKVIDEINQYYGKNRK